MLMVAQVVENKWGNLPLPASTNSPTTVAGEEKGVGDSRKHADMKMTIEQSDSLKAEREMYNALKARKEALEEALRKKTEEFKKLCLQEGELTGQLPKDTPLAPGEQPPVFRRRVGTAFSLSVKNVPDDNQTSSELEKLELEVELQGKITSAAQRLASDKTVGKNVRKQRLQSYNKANLKLKEMEKKLGDLRRAAGKSATERQSRAYQGMYKGGHAPSTSKCEPLTLQDLVVDFVHDDLDPAADGSASLSPSRADSGWASRQPSCASSLNSCGTGSLTSGRSPSLNSFSASASVHSGEQSPTSENALSTESGFRDGDDGDDTLSRDTSRSSLNPSSSSDGGSSRSSCDGYSQSSLDPGFGGASQSSLNPSCSSGEDLAWVSGETGSESHSGGGKDSGEVVRRQSAGSQRRESPEKSFSAYFDEDVTLKPTGVRKKHFVVSRGVENSRLQELRSGCSSGSRSDSRSRVGSARPLPLAEAESISGPGGSAKDEDTASGSMSREDSFDFSDCEDDEIKLRREENRFSARVTRRKQTFILSRNLRKPLQMDSGWPDKINTGYHALERLLMEGSCHDELPGGPASPCGLTRAKSLPPESQRKHRAATIPKQRSVSTVTQPEARRLHSGGSYSLRHRTIKYSDIDESDNNNDSIDNSMENLVSSSQNSDSYDDYTLGKDSTLTRDRTLTRDNAWNRDDTLGKDDTLTRDKTLAKSVSDVVGSVGLSRYAEGGRLAGGDCRQHHEGMRRNTSWHSQSQRSNLSTRTTNSSVETTV